MLIVSLCLSAPAISGVTIRRSSMPYLDVKTHEARRNLDSAPDSSRPVAPAGRPSQSPAMGMSRGQSSPGSDRDACQRETLVTSAPLAATVVRNPAEREKRLDPSPGAAPQRPAPNRINVVPKPPFATRSSRWSRSYSSSSMGSTGAPVYGSTIPGTVFE